VDDEEGEDQAQCDAHQAFDPFGVWKGKGIEFAEPEEGGQKNHQRENNGRTDDDQKEEGWDEKTSHEDLFFGDFFQIHLVNLRFEISDFRFFQSAICN
jgi:hypothetical protein